MNIIIIYMTMFFVLFSGNIVQADSDNLYTSSYIVNYSTNVFNGNAWRKLNRNQKLIYLEGIITGVGMFYNKIFENETSEVTHIAVLHQSTLLMSDSDLNDIVEEIDLFYKQASNRNIPVFEGYYYSVSKYKGETIEKLNNLETELRLHYNK